MDDPRVDGPPDPTATLTARGLPSRVGPILGAVHFWAMTATSGEPAPHWERDVLLADGGTVHVRPIRPTDAQGLEAFHGRLSADSVYFRYFSPKPSLTAQQVEHLTTVDHRDRVALVAEVGDRLLGVARYEREGSTDSAEAAFLVNDEEQGRGIGTALLELLAAAGRERGITRFTAEVLPHNRRMLGVFRAAGFQDTARFDGDVVHVELLIEPTERSRAAIEGREHTAEVASMTRLLCPRSVAVIGAGRDPGSVGHQVLRNLLRGGFEGPVYPVNPMAEHVASVKAYPTVGEVPGRVDLAVVSVPAPAVAEVVRQCAAKGVAGLVVLTAGFSEVGDVEGQAALRDLARRNGMRLVGPNCIGVVNTAVGLDATFAPTPPVRGGIAMQSQSGALGIALLERSARMGLGVSTFVSTGNKADVSGNDLLNYWEDDPTTGVILLYLESVGNPRKFARIARRVSRRKPIVAVKSGRSAVGMRAASSHTAALASPDVAVDTLFRQTGVIRVDTLDQLFDMALLLGTQPLPGGKRVAIVTNSGGPGIMVTDACVAAGLEVPELSAETQAALRAFVDPNAALTNPVDLVASATADVYERALPVILADPSVDAVIVISTVLHAAPPEEIAEVLLRVAATADKTLLGCILAWAQLPPMLGRDRPGPTVPLFSAPEPAARALARAAQYAEWRRRPPGTVPELAGFDAVTAGALVDRYLAEVPGGGWLPPDAVTAVLGAAGIPVVATAEVTSGAEAARVAEEMGFPAVLKAAGPDIVHKSDLGGVRLELGSAAEVASAYEDLAAGIGARMTGAVVQPMAAPGVETIVGVVQDPMFGPLVMFGLGGTATELLGDQAFRILPVTDQDAAEMVRSLRSSPLLFGYRGAPMVAVAALEDVLQRVARLAGAVPALAELDINPLRVSPDGALAVDARLRVAPVPPGPPLDLG